MATFIEREFAGEVRRFQIHQADSLRLYRGIEGEGLGNLSEFAQRATAGSLGETRILSVIAHALSRGHPTTLTRMKELVQNERREKPLAEFIELAVAIIVASYAGTEQ